MRDQGDAAPMLIVYGAGLTGELVVLPRALAEAPVHAVRRAPRRNDLGRASRAFTAATHDEIVTRRDRDEEGVSPRKLPIVGRGWRLAGLLGVDYAHRAPRRSPGTLRDDHGDDAQRAIPRARCRNWRIRSSPSSPHEAIGARPMRRWCARRRVIEDQAVGTAARVSEDDDNGLLMRGYPGYNRSSG